MRFTKLPLSVCFSRALAAAAALAFLALGFGAILHSHAGEEHGSHHGRQDRGSDQPCQLCVWAHAAASADAPPAAAVPAARSIRSARPSFDLPALSAAPEPLRPGRAPPVLA